MSTRRKKYRIQRISRSGMRKIERCEIRARQSKDAGLERRGAL